MVTLPLDSHDSIATAVQLLRPQTLVQPALHAAGSWALRFPAFHGIRIGLVGRGQCWLRLSGQEPVRLRYGDSYFLCSPPSYVLSSDLDEEPQDIDSVTGSTASGDIRIGSQADEDTYVCGGRFDIDQTNAALLLDVLPPLVHVSAADPRRESLTSLGTLLRAELGEHADGGSLVISNLAQILVIHMLRAHAQGSTRPLGWLGALADGGVGNALRAMHADVAHQWTLDELASIAHMSRSGFAAAFNAKVGTAPLTYLINWRMSLARNALRYGQQTITEIAAAAGYQSESAFSTAFRRVVGTSPRDYRKIPS